MEALLLFSGVLLAWYWYSGVQSRAQAVQAARRACERHGQQLLDETVLLDHLRVQRGRDGRLRWRREYSFEFSGVGELRQRGSVVLFAGRVIDLRLEMENGTVFDSH